MFNKKIYKFGIYIYSICPVVIIISYLAHTPDLREGAAKGVKNH